MILLPHLPGYQLFDEAYAFLFNSYYEVLGPRQVRHQRGMITRPSAQGIQAYRSHVDQAMVRLLENYGDCSGLLELGCYHEQQHQELLLMDILHLFAQNPIRPAFQNPKPLGLPPADAVKVRWVDFPGGIQSVGFGQEGFAYDCEKSRHQVLLHPFRLASRLVTNGEWLEFMEDGGYTHPTLWLSDGIAAVREKGWQAPLYWERRDQQWQQMTLSGMQPVDPKAPVCHISYFEADAFARWAGKRLPLEHEWESAAADQPIAGNFMEQKRLRPAQAQENGTSLLQLYGDVWEWTASPFAAYPNFQPAVGAIGEYNGKFMCGQFVLRGGSCVTPIRHIRPTYRNFFYPHQRWMFSGLRLAEGIK